MTRGTAGRVAANTLLNVAALGGLVCIVLVLVSALCNVSLIMFKTGSMSPTIPSGSLAVVREIPATEIEVGDVLTVDRPGELPVTHRVTSVEGSGESRTITMRGDANEAEDPLPYTVTDARIVMMSVPHLAKAVVWFSNPWVLGGLTLSASALVTWAFWPRRRSDPDAPRHARGAPANNHASAVLALGAIAMGAGSLALTPTGAQAAVSSHAQVVIQSEHITLTSIGDADAMRTMRPGVPVTWQVGVRVNAPEPGTVEVSLEAAGSRELGLALDVSSCDTAWVDGACAGDETLLESRQHIDGGADAIALTALSSAEERWLLLTAVMPEQASGMVALTVRAAGGGEAVTTSPRPVAPLPTTGGEPAWTLGFVAIAAGLAVAGAASLARGRRAVEE